MTGSLGSSTSSLLSCYTCGLTDNTLDENNSNGSTMQRDSTSRRSETLQATLQRSRSVEAGGSHNINGTNDDSLHERIAGATIEEADYEDSKPLSSRSSFHRRSMSDPFDSREANVLRRDDHPEHSSTPIVPSGQVLPTLPRTPITATRNKNCWSEPPVDIFHVRGPTYLQDHKKVPSGNYLLSARGCDMFLAAQEPLNFAKQSNFILGGRLRSAATLAIDFRFPWGHMIMYYEIPARLVPYMKGTSSPAADVDASLSVPEQTLARWLQGDADYKNERLKLIPYVAEGPWVVRNMVTGKPAIIGKRLPVSYHHIASNNNNNTDVLCCTLDIGSSSATAKRIVSVCRRYMSALTVDIGFVIQGETEQELPEQMLGAVRVHGADPLKAPKLS